MTITARDVWDIVWIKQKGIDVSTELVNKKLEAREKTRKDFTEALLTQITKLLKDDKVRIDFNTEMSRFVPESIRQRTIDNPEYWDYVQTEIKSMAMPMFKDDKPRNRFGMSL